MSFALPGGRIALCLLAALLLLASQGRVNAQPIANVYIQQGSRLSLSSCSSCLSHRNEHVLVSDFLSLRCNRLLPQVWLHDSSDARAPGRQQLLRVQLDNERRCELWPASQRVRFCFSPSPFEPSFCANLSTSYCGFKWLGARNTQLWIRLRLSYQHASGSQNNFLLVKNSERRRCRLGMSDFHAVCRPCERLFMEPADVAALPNLLAKRRGRLNDVSCHGEQLSSSSASLISFRCARKFDPCAKNQTGEHE